MALVILVGACHVVVVRGNFLWTSTDKSRGEEGGPKKRSSSVQQQYYKVGHHQKEISDYMQMQTIDYGFNHVFDIVNRIDKY